MKLISDFKRNNDSLLFSILDCTDDYCFVLKKDFTIVFANKSFKKLVNKRKVIKKNINKVFPKFSSSLLYRHCTESISTNKLIYVEEYYPPSCIWIKYSITSNHDYLIISGKDITKEKDLVKLMEKQENDVKFLSSVINTSSQAFFSCLSDGTLLMTNEAFRNIVGYEEHELDKMDWYQITPPEWRAEEEQRLSSLLNPGDYVRYKKEYVKKDKKRVPVEILVQYVNNFDGIPFYNSFVTDITDRVKEEKRLKEEIERKEFEEKKLKTILDILPIGVVIADKDGVIQNINNFSRSIRGSIRNINDYKKSKGVWVSTGKSIAAEEWPLVKALKGKTSFNEEATIETKDGLKKTVLISAIPLKDNKGNVTNAVSVIIDITKRKRAEEIIKRMAYYDSLTKLPNRMFLNMSIIKLINHSKKNGSGFAVVFLDLDRFKNINDSMGHALGDQILKQVSLRLKSICQNGEIAARIGGDEFMILLPNINKRSDTTKFIASIFNQFKTPFYINKLEIYITSSIGISIFPKDGEDIESLVKYADIAMYNAKIKGKNTFRFYTHSMNNTSLEKIKLESELRIAITNNQLQLYYQPQIDTKTNHVKGFETLIRWNHPTLGILLPSSFLNIAEETGLIVSIDKWVIKKALEQRLILDSLNKKDLSIAINISGKTLREINFVNFIKNILGENKDYGKMEIEISEGMLLEGNKENLSLLEKIKQMSIDVCIDDFGTGYSSLGYLKIFPIDKLKIDKSFVMNIGKDEKANSIVSSIITLSKSLDLKVVAEGVETLSQKNFLESNGCDFIQGFFYCQPVAFKNVYEAIKSNHSKISATKSSLPILRY